MHRKEIKTMEKSLKKGIILLVTGWLAAGTSLFLSHINPRESWIDFTSGFFNGLAVVVCAAAILILAYRWARTHVHS